MSSNPKSQILKSLQKATGVSEISLDIPEREEFGDYSSNIAMQLWSKHEARSTKSEANNKSQISNDSNILTKSDLVSNLEHSDLDIVSNFDIRISNLKTPHSLAEHIKSQLDEDAQLAQIVSKIEVAGAGFLNFHLKPDVLLDNLLGIEKAGAISKKRKAKSNSTIPRVKSAHTPGMSDANFQAYGQSALYKNKKILIEHTSPNPQTTIMLGHLRNNFLGMSVANLFEFLGAKVTRDCIVNDRGVHICRSIWGYLAFANKNGGLKKEELKNYKDVTEEQMAEIITGLNWMELLKYWANNPADWFTPDELELKPDHANLIWYVLGSKAYKSDESVRKQVGEILQAWEREEEDVCKIWKQILDWSAKGYEETYKRIGSVHDHVWYESALYKGGKELVEEGLKKGVFVKSEGAIVTNLAKYKLPDTVAIKSDGTSTYLVFDLNLTAEKQRKYPSDLYIWTIGQEQSLYFQQLFSVCEQLGLGKKEDFFHLSYALINFKGGGKMATREGSVVMADEILDELETKVKKIIDDDVKKKKKEGVNIEKLAHDVALGAVKYALLRYGRETTAFYDTNESISLDGNSGPYLQYTFARTCSVLAKSKIKSQKSKIRKGGDGVILGRSEATTPESNHLTIQQFNNEELSVMKALFHFPEIVESAAEDYAPNLICNYLFDLAQKFNTFYNRHRIIDETISGVKAENTPGMSGHSGLPAEVLTKAGALAIESPSHSHPGGLEGTGKNVLPGEEDHECVILEEAKNRHVILEGAERPICKAYRFPIESGNSHPEFISGSQQSNPPSPAEQDSDGQSHLAIEQFRILLTKSVGTVLKTGLNLLGIQAPRRM